MTLSPKFNPRANTALVRVGKLGDTDAAQRYRLPTAS